MLVLSSKHMSHKSKCIILLSCIYTHFPQSHAGAIKGRGEAKQRIASYTAGHTSAVEYVIAADVSERGSCTVLPSIQKRILCVAR